MGQIRHGPVLVVEDHALNRLLLQRILEADQIEVIAAESIADAERALDRTCAPLIVLDMYLPDGYGLDLARRVKADPYTSACAIVACTANASPSEEALARSIGCAAYVTKPLDIRRFPGLVRSLIPAPVLGHH